jgi:phage regulator Rha-like protein
MSNNFPKVPDVYIVNKILLLRGQRVMLDGDLAELYDVPTKVLNQAVKRNLERFPEDFMFQLTKEENDSLRSQFVTLKRGQHTKYLPYVFTEHGVLMLANVLKSERAIHMSVQIIRVFVQMREMALTHKDILVKLLKIEKKVTEHDEELKMLFDAVKGLLSEPKKERVKIGYKVGKK